jgi:hypothetical protein
LVQINSGPVANQFRYQAARRILRAVSAVDPNKTNVGSNGFQITGFCGQLFFGKESAEPLLDIALTAGTYQVMTQLGKIGRSYTMAIEPGTSFELFLRLKSQLH